MKSQKFFYNIRDLDLCEIIYGLYFNLLQSVKRLVVYSVGQDSYGRGFKQSKQEFTHIT